MLPLLLLAWPIAEIAVIVILAEHIGVLLTFVLLVLGWPVGIWAIKSQGRAALARLNAAVAAKRSPGREVLDGALVLIGGLLLMVPGFITDALGLVCLLPPTRALFRGTLARNLNHRFVGRAVRMTGSHEYDVDSTAIDVDDRHLQA